MILAAIDNWQLYGGFRAGRLLVDNLVNRVFLRGGKTWQNRKNKCDGRAYQTRRDGREVVRSGIAKGESIKGRYIAKEDSDYWQP